jgi:leucyl-tRNA synthetase
VLPGYGTGAIFAYPAHDERDYAFAKTLNLPIIEMVEGCDISEAAYTGDSPHVNTDFLNGLKTPDAIEKAVVWLEEHNIGKRSVNYCLCDWLFSRKRY